MYTKHTTLALHSSRSRDLGKSTSVRRIFHAAKTQPIPTSFVAEFMAPELGGVRSSPRRTKEPTKPP
ncbi:hypothetical protein JTE90_023215 [Oedothorax gibbosus]|uniref:Uncharacterized protein n=1 Tax=Oedothorax gibbosus TaxID=931172 RepID=A0AAV6VMD1_9ARAC|nr:hypothetical protein JTE90_023215 [Oedothorax gibbosus]